MFGRLLNVIGMLMIASALYEPRALAQTPTTIYSFGGVADATSPVGELILHNGMLYGVSRGNGNNPLIYGTVFQVNPATGQEAVLHTFKKGPGGAVPYNGLTLFGSDLYGATSLGGINKDGTVFRISPRNGHFKVIDSPTYPADGSYLNAFTQQSSTLFGTAMASGEHEDGVLFAIDPKSGTETVLYNFAGPDGAGPSGTMISVQGILYGTTIAGGQYDKGTVFSYNPATQAETVLYSFPNSQQYVSPVEGVIYANGFLYGTTDGYGSKGPGTVFQLDPVTGAYTLLSTMQDPPNTSIGMFRLLYKNGKLYGTTDQGGASGNGSIYVVNIATRTAKTLYSFTGGVDGAIPAGGLIDGGDVFYGLTEGGGAAGAGTVFSFKP